MTPTLGKGKGNRGRRRGEGNETQHVQCLVLAVPLAACQAPVGGFLSNIGRRVWRHSGQTDAPLFSAALSHESKDCHRGPVRLRPPRTQRRGNAWWIGNQDFSSIAVKNSLTCSSLA